MAKRTLALLGLSALTMLALGKAQAEPKTVQVYAHRGARAFLPENTMPAYKASLRMGCDWVDMDVVLTKDGEVLISHNPVLNPDIVRDPQGHFLQKSHEAAMAMSPADQAAYVQKYAVKNLTLAEAQQYDVGRLNPDSPYARYFPDQTPIDGTHMPTLREVIRYVNRTTNNHVGFQIEMKTDPTHPSMSADPKVFAKALYKVMTEENALDRCEIQAFDFRCLDELQKLNPHVKSAYLTSRENEPGGEDDFATAKGELWTGGKRIQAYGGSIPRMVKGLGGYAWEPEDYELTRTRLDEAHRLGLKVVVWSWPEKLGRAFDPTLVARMIDWGVDGIITDDPGRLMSMMAARGMALPRRYQP
jgi:glycerophosphoryl diester phosphodiesterase